MVTIYLVSEGIPKRERVIGEMPLRRCIDELGLDPGQRIIGLREAGPVFGNPSLMGERDPQHVVASVAALEASPACPSGHYWLALSPDEARRRLGTS